MESGQDAVQVADQRGIATARRGEAGDVERHHSGVLPRSAFDEIAAARRVETTDPRTVGLLGLHETAGRVEGVLPVLRPTRKERLVRTIAQRARERGKREVRGVVFQLRGNRTVEIAALVRTIARQVAGCVEVVQSRPVVVRRIRLMKHRGERCRRVEVARAEGVVACDDRYRRIAHHHIRFAVVLRPLRQLAALLVVHDHRLRDVTRLRRRDHLLTDAWRFAPPFACLLGPAGAVTGPLASEWTAVAGEALAVAAPAASANATATAIAIRPCEQATLSSTASMRFSGSFGSRPVRRGASTLSD